MSTTQTASALDRWPDIDRDRIVKGSAPFVGIGLPTVPRPSSRAHVTVCPRFAANNSASAIAARRVA